MPLVDELGAVNLLLIASVHEEIKQLFFTAIKSLKNNIPYSIFMTDDDHYHAILSINRANICQFYLIYMITVWKHKYENF